MLTATDLLIIIQEQKKPNIKQLAKKLEIQEDHLHKILTNLEKHNLIEYNPETGRTALPKWLLNINKRMEAIKPTTGEIILPRYQEMQIQDIIIGNYTKDDLELKVRLKTNRKEIAICNIT
jgi:predicted ArsR family transcriptional regulator